MSLQKSSSGLNRPDSPSSDGPDMKGLKDELTCSICLELCIRPCSTPCGHSFCRKCLRDALRYSPRCPKCRDQLPSRFELNVNSVLWNTIRMLFPKTKDAPASPPADPSPLRRNSDRRHSRLLTATELEILRRIEMEREHAPSVTPRMNSGESLGGHRRRRIIRSTREDRGSRSPESSGGLAAVASVGAASARSHEDERTNELNHRETRQLFHWRTRSGNQHGHGSGMPHSLTRSASYGDLHNDVEYVAIRRLERLDQVPEHRRRGVYRIDNQGPARIIYRQGQGSPVDYQYFDEDDFETASEVMSDRESSFTSSTAGRHRVNSFRFREEVSASPVSTVEGNAQESGAASFRGYERLYDISSQIEAAMNEIERISL